MAKFLLLSLLIMSVAIPMYFARVRPPRKGLRETTVAMAVYICLWILFCIYVYAKIAG